MYPFEPDPPGLKNEAARADDLNVHSQVDDSAPRLAPLPRRVGDLDGDQAMLSGSAEAAVAEMLERTAALFRTLETDVESLRADQKRDQERIAAETERLRSEADAAVEVLAQLTARALDIEQRKGREGVIDAALRGPAPAIDDVTFDAIAGSIAEEIRLAKGITGAIRVETIGQLLRSATAYVEKMLADAEASRKRLMAQTDLVLDAETVEATASFEIGTGVLERDLHILDSALAPPGRDWSDPIWETWEPTGKPTGCILLGTYTDPRLGELTIPAIFDLPGARGLVIEPGRHLDAALDALRSIMLRIVASLPPGGARFTIFDPEGLGDAAGALLGFTETAPHILGRGVHTSTESIETALVELGGHMERVVQRYLRGRFTSLAEADSAAGEMLEAFHFVVIVNHPRDLSDESLELLAKLYTQGPRCGVYPITVRDPEYKPVYGGPKVPPLEPAFTISATADGFEVVTADAGAWSIVLDSAPRRAITDRIVVTTADRAMLTTRAGLDPAKAFAMLGDATADDLRRDIPKTAGLIDPADPGTWWSADSSTGVGVPLGRSGAVDLATAWLDGTHSGGALLVGGSDADVDRVLEWVVLGLAITYPPDQLRVDLVGLRDRRVFAQMGTHALPQAAVISMDAEVEMAISVIDSSTREIDRRLRLDPGADRPRRRIVFLDDIATLLSSSSDKRAARAITQLERLVDEGPTVGVHVFAVLRDAGADPASEMAASTNASIRLLDGLSTRIIVAGTHPDVVARLGGDTTEFDGISTGEALLVTGPADRRASRRLRLVVIEQNERDMFLRELRKLATGRRLADRPQVLDGRAVARFEQAPLAQFLINARNRDERLLPRLWLGEPMELGGPVEVLLRRQEGSNLLLVGSDEEMGQGILLAAVTTSVLGHGRNLDVRAVDFMSLDSGFALSATSLGAHWPVFLERRRNLHKVIDHVHRIVVDRGTSGRYQDNPVLLVLNGVNRAREFGDDSELVSMLESITHSGPGLGVHTLVWSETPDAPLHRLGSRVVNEFGVRIVMGIDADSSNALIDSPAAAELADNQALLYDEGNGRLTRFRPYAMADPEWAAGLSSAAAGAR